LDAIALGLASLPRWLRDRSRCDGDGVDDGGPVPRRQRATG
jgi:hypothetical protein